MPKGFKTAHALAEALCKKIDGLSLYQEAKGRPIVTKRVDDQYAALPDRLPVTDEDVSSAHIASEAGAGARASFACRMEICRFLFDAETYGNDFAEAAHALAKEKLVDRYWHIKEQIVSDEDCEEGEDEDAAPSGPDIFAFREERLIGMMARFSPPTGGYDERDFEILFLDETCGWWLEIVVNNDSSVDDDMLLGLIGSVLTASFPAVDTWTLEPSDDDSEEDEEEDEEDE